MEKFSSAHLIAAQSVDPDNDGGELLITVPPEIAAEHVVLNKFFEITVEYSIEEPVGGLHFVIPECEGSYAEVCRNGKRKTVFSFFVFSQRLINHPRLCRKVLMFTRTATKIQHVYGSRVLIRIRSLAHGNWSSRLMRT